MKIKRNENYIWKESKKIDQDLSKFHDITDVIVSYISLNANYCENSKLYRASGEMTHSMDKAALHTFLVCCMKEYGLLEDLLVSIKLPCSVKTSSDTTIHDYLILSKPVGNAQSSSVKMLTRCSK